MCVLTAPLQDPVNVGVYVSIIPHGQKAFALEGFVLKAPAAEGLLGLALRAKRPQKGFWSIYHIGITDLENSLGSLVVGPQAEGCFRLTLGVKVLKYKVPTENHSL